MNGLVGWGRGDAHAVVDGARDDNLANIRVDSIQGEGDIVQVDGELGKLGVELVRGIARAAIAVGWIAEKAGEGGRKDRVFAKKSSQRRVNGRGYLGDGSATVDDTGAETGTDTSGAQAHTSDRDGVMDLLG